jgi:hypothetical protein
MQTENGIGNAAMWGGEDILIKFLNAEPSSAKHRGSI